MPFTEKELKIYLTEYFMNAPVTDHLEYEEESDVPVVDKVVIPTNDIDSKVTFKYLEKDSLSLDIQYQRDYLKQYTLHLCIFDVVQTLRLPFIRYLFVNNNNTFELPNTQLNMRPFIEINESKYGIAPSNEDEDELQDVNLIDEEFLDQISALFEKQTGLVLNIDTMYKGFLEDKNNNIIVFVDATSETITKTDLMDYAIIDEIINVGNIRDIVIAKLVTNIFKEYELLHNIVTVEGIKVQFPKIGYICDENDENEYVNLFKEDSANEDKLIVPPSIDHEMYDNIYVFSAIPLTVSNLSLIRRFACFVENEDDDIQTDNISFSENDIQYYGLYELDLFKEL